MLVTSAALEKAAAQIRRSRHGPQFLLAAETRVTAAQLSAAARLIREADPSVITHVNGRKVPKPIVEERPGFIYPSDDKTVLVLHVGILPSRVYQIGRRGKVTEQVGR